MTVNQETGELLTTEEIRVIAAYIQSFRESPAPFDIALNGETWKNDSQEIERVQAYAMPEQPGGLNSRPHERRLSNIANASG